MYKLLDLSSGGHREEFRTVFQRALGATRINLFSSFFDNSILIIGNLDDHLFIYGTVYRIRKLFGLETILVCLSTLHLFPDEQSLRFRLKSLISNLIYFDANVLLTWGRATQRIKSLVDLQWFDLPMLLSPNDIKELKYNIDNVKPSIGYFGAIHNRKCFSEFRELAFTGYTDHEFITINKEQQSVELRHAHFMRHERDDGTTKSFVQKMANVDIVWCCTEIESGLSSGVFGRAIQLGKVCIIRKGTYLHEFYLENLNEFPNVIIVDFNAVGWVHDCIRQISKLNKESLVTEGLDYEICSKMFKRFKDQLNGIHF